MQVKHDYHFDKFGRTYHFRIRTARDLERVLTLDKSLWIATSAPLSSLNGDKRFLELVDTDANGRIRTDEMLAAIRWILDRLADASGLPEGAGGIPLSAVNAEHADGAACLATAQYVHEALHIENRESVDLKQLQAFRSSLESNVINGDGVIAADAAADSDVAAFINDILACLPGCEDRTGVRGISATDLGAFLQEARAWLAWAAQGDAAGPEATHVMPLGAQTTAAYAALSAIREKVDGFFARCRVVWFDPAAAHHARVASQGALGALLDDAETVEAALSKAPLADPNPEGRLPLEGRLNPLYAVKVANLRTQTIEPLLGDLDVLTAEQWQRVKTSFAGHEAWLAAKKGASVEKLGAEKLKRYLEPRFAEGVRELLARDREVADRLSDLKLLEKLLLYHQGMMRLANNFVGLPELYSPDARALFELGSLVMDGRWFNFAVLAQNLNEHVECAKESNTFVLYVELSRADETEKRTVVIPVTSGTSGTLRVGKRGVFFDVNGREYDARVVRIIENPVSFKETLLAPFKALGRLIVGKIEAISGSAQKELESTVSRTADQVQTGVQQTVREAPEQTAGAAAQQGAQAETPQAAQSNRRDLLVGASVSVAALSSAFAFITKTLAGLKISTILAAVVVGLVLVFLPSAIVAFLKLRKRDLSAILEGSGWAINVRMRLTRRQRAQFTRREPYPADASGTPRARWIGVVLGLAAVAAACWGAWHGWRYLREHEESAVTNTATPATAPVPETPVQQAPPADGG